MCFSNVNTRRFEAYVFWRQNDMRLGNRCYFGKTEGFIGRVLYSLCSGCRGDINTGVGFEREKRRDK